MTSSCSLSVASQSAPERIAQAAGQKSSSAVQYNFGSREGLIEATIEWRMIPVESRRAELLATAGPASGDTIESLLMTLVEPLAFLAYRYVVTRR